MLEVGKYYKMLVSVNFDYACVDKGEFILCLKCINYPSLGVFKIKCLAQRNIVERIIASSCLKKWFEEIK